VFISVGWGRVWRYEGRAYGGLNLGAGVTIRSSSGWGFGWIEGVWLSPANLSVTRMSVAVGR